ncbi:MAG: DUF4921 family protein [Propionibacteriaceae bacterium]|jgi:hypothetical protein|nr:DUF4921 family protein [Propionibacteriaceae bacterium]
MELTGHAKCFQGWWIVRCQEARQQALCHLRAERSIAEIRIGNECPDARNQLRSSSHCSGCQENLSFYPEIRLMYDSDIKNLPGILHQYA